MTQRDQAGKDVHHIRVIKNREENVLRGEESVLRRWKEHFNEPTNKENRREKYLEDIEII